MQLEDSEVRVVKGDITDADVEAVVNAANAQLSMHQGVAGAIRTRGGEEIQEEAQRHQPQAAGGVVLTGAGSLRARYVFHAVTVAEEHPLDEATIRKATFNTLRLADEKKIASIAFPALGCGVGGFSAEAASKIMAQEVFRYIRDTGAPSLKKIWFVVHAQETYAIFKSNVCRYLEYMQQKLSQGPFLTVDGIIEYKEGIVMVKRSNPPLGWALPGGFVDYGESVEKAVAREVKEETNLDFVNIQQFKVYSQPDRDPRFHTVAVVFIGQGKGVLKADSDAREVNVFESTALPKDIAFDHRDIIHNYVLSKRKNDSH